MFEGKMLKLWRLSFKLDLKLVILLLPISYKSKLTAELFFLFCIYGTFKVFKSSSPLVNACIVIFN
jgi:hypothetical protein